MRVNRALALGVCGRGHVGWECRWHGPSNIRDIWFYGSLRDCYKYCLYELTSLVRLTKKLKSYILITNTTILTVSKVEKCTTFVSHLLKLKYKLIYQMKFQILYPNDKCKAIVNKKN